MDKDEKKTEYQNIVFTDIQFHTVKPTNPAPWYRIIMKSLRSDKPGRIYSKDFAIKNFQEEDGKITMNFTIPMPEKLKEKIEEIEKTGKRVRFFLPKNGLPMYLGKDMIEKINAEKRHLAKRI